MEAIEAIKAAKDYILEVFADEGIVELGLEELEMDEADSGVWEVTIGFRRGWQKPYAPNPPLTGLQDVLRPRDPKREERTYKTVRIRDDGTVVSMKHRDVSVPY